ncbi:multiple inositol polyphosphate phosphatase 1 isoform X1 [Cynara cardunculus var. scolymus]|uniref:multiple inositol polyphosphate phosphatase 1 isoform X1 n=1 Tax=Cynara cardunculus var. scolymus TaxID=59895 RepID=UPI000D62FD95|nr:multiple inositol polyphosphate phosphatase 1 isoform X1 [Cynara cardunculus var. scolymus]
MAKPVTIGFMLLVLYCVQFSSTAEETFDVRQHLSTVTRYEASKHIKDNAFVSSNIPDKCSPIHLNLVARHGTRAPTKKRMKDLETLSTRLKDIMQSAKERGSSLEKLPSWLREWSSPWKGKIKGGELISLGEDEMYHLGSRVRERFQELFSDEYHPDVYLIRATQIPRASASAVAFGMGMFSGRGNLGPGRHRAFAVLSESRASDIMLRFHDCCQNYKAFRKNQEPSVHKLKEPVLDEITRSLAARYELNLTIKDTSTLWFLCKQEASLLNVTNQACDLFSNDEVKLLEWTDDLEMFILKGYGNSLNYRMGVPLLEDVILSMEQAITAKEEGHAPGSYEKARLRFAHAETLVPFSCLIGLFLEGSEFDQIQREEPLKFPPKPPQKRTWRGSTVAPFGGNNVLVLYSCSANNTSKFFVQVLHNEKPIPMAGCGATDFCPFEVFKEKIGAAHLKHSYDHLCNAKLQQQSKPFMSKLIEIFSWIFTGKSNDNESQKTEL